MLIRKYFKYICGNAERRVKTFIVYLVSFNDSILDRKDEEKTQKDQKQK